MSRPSRLAIVHAGLVLFAAALIAQSAKVQIVHGQEWAEQGRRQHFVASSLPVERGEILDASGETLVESRELTRLAVAPREIRDTATLMRGLRAAGVDTAVLRAIADPRRKWVDVPGLFNTVEIAQLVGLRGIHATPTMQRVYSSSSGIRRIVGRVDASGRALDGIESALDSVLRGDSATSVVARDKRGNAIGSPEDADRVSTAGASVVLTINRSLQEICERELGIAIDTLHAAGGDIVVMNPRTGEVLALASQRAGTAPFSNTAVTEPFEPGSTLKPLVVAALLSKNRALPTDMISTNHGTFELNGRTITDLHKADSLSLADVLRFSSNIGIVRFGERLTPREKYENFRDFGFGASTGIPLPAESPGVLREPKTWSKQTPASILMGYEIEVTPLQLVTAYSAIANGGELLEPHIVKEVRGADGKVLYSAHREVVRRVIPAPVAQTIRQMLLAVVQNGTGVKADLQNFLVAGKSGTARRSNGQGGYAAGSYTASFVGIFPVDDPQYVVLVKLDSPTGPHFYGGDIAAPVSSIVLRAALAARDAALDRETLAASERRDTSALANAARAAAAETIADATPDSDAGSVSYVVHLPASDRTAPVTVTQRVVPDVSGMTLRAAAHALHAAGFRVQLVTSFGAGTLPAAGSIALAGTAVQLSRFNQ